MVDETQAVELQLAVEQRVDSSKAEQERLRHDYDRKALLGRGLFRCASERESQRFPFTDTRRVPKGLLSAIGTVSEDTQLSEEDIRLAEKASYGIALELAAQVSEAQLPRAGGVRDDSDSLEALASGLRKGGSLGNEYLQSNPEVVIKQAREAIARRLNKPSEDVQWEDQRLILWTKEQFGKADRRLVGSAAALRGYYER